MGEFCLFIVFLKYFLNEEEIKTSPYRLHKNLNYSHFLYSHPYVILLFPENSNFGGNISFNLALSSFRIAVKLP